MADSYQMIWAKVIFKKFRMRNWYFHWKSSQDNKRTPLSDCLPWMTYEAIDWLEHNLTSQMHIFEWGSGGSTLFFSRRVKQVVSVEHDPRWYDEVIKTIVKNRNENISYSLVPPEKTKVINLKYASSGKEYKNMSFEKYVRAIDKFPDNTFDIIVVDGRARPGCIEHAKKKVVCGGYLILDNSERNIYASALEVVSDWKSFQFFGPGPYNHYPWETRIWLKPSHN